jgi:hypothetical protein
MSLPVDIVIKVNDENVLLPPIIKVEGISYPTR